VYSKTAKTYLTMGKQLPYEYRKSPPVLAAIMISGHFGFEKLKTALRPALGSYANFC